MLLCEFHGNRYSPTQMMECGGTTALVCCRTTEQHRSNYHCHYHDNFNHHYHSNCHCHYHYHDNIIISITHVTRHTSHVTPAENSGERDRMWRAQACRAACRHAVTVNMRVTHHKSRVICHTLHITRLTSVRPVALVYSASRAALRQPHVSNQT